MIQDAFLSWNGDLSAGAGGDIALVNGNDLAQQRIIRRLLTNPGDLLWDPDYGGGLGQLVGQTLDVLAVGAIIRAQIFQEDSVSPTPEPSIDVQAYNDGSLFISIRYVNASTGQPQSITLPIGG